MFQKFRILIKTFSSFGESFTAALCKLHYKCLEEHLKGFFSLKTTGLFCQFRFFNSRFWALFRKIFCPDFQRSIRREDSNILRENKFFKEIFIISGIIGHWAKNFQFFDKKTLIGKVIYYDLNVSKAALPRKIVLSKQFWTLPISSDVERKLIEFSGKVD